MRINSIRFKISILYTSILGIILVIYSGILYFGLKWTLYNDLDGELRTKAVAICDTINSYIGALDSDRRTFLFAAKRVIAKKGEHPKQDKMTELERQWLKRLDKLDLENDYIDLLSPKDELVVGSGNLPKHQFSFFPRNIKSLSSYDDSFVSIRFENRNLRVISRPLFHDGERYTIQIGTSLKPIIELLKDRLNFVMATIPLILIFTSLIGRFLVAKILEPVTEITATAKNITHEDLSARVRNKAADEEMRYLVDTFNDMIERLEKSFKYVSEFSSHIAHELKTPLAIIRGETELVLRKDVTPAEYKRVLQESLDEIRRILKVIDDLLLLTRLQHQDEVFKFEKFAIEEFLQEFYEQSRLLASQRNISVNFELPKCRTIVNADRIHLRRLFFNLISNAVKFALDGGKIDMDIDYRDRNVFVSVSDTGVGISKENLSRIFDKFFHSANAELNLEPGTGLGLNIALAIAKIHSGDIAVKSEHGKGSTFTVMLPQA